MPDPRLRDNLSPTPLPLNVNIDEVTVVPQDKHSESNPAKQLKVCDGSTKARAKHTEGEYSGCFRFSGLGTHNMTRSEAKTLQYRK